MLARTCPIIAACIMLGLAACPAPGRSGTPAPADPCQLAFDGSVLRLVSPDGELVQLSVPDAVPYQIVLAAEPAVVTTCGADLIPVTYVIGAEILRFDNMLPQLAEPPVIALFSLSTEENTPGGRTVLIGADGAKVWEHENAQLLLPSCGKLDTAPVLAVPCSDSFIQPFGVDPQLTAIDPRTGAELWRTIPPAAGAPDDVELACVAGGFGLLALQYGYDVFRYLAVDFGTGEMTELHALLGQPATVIVQPGAMPAYRHCIVDGTKVDLMVVDMERGSGVLSFDLAARTAGFTPRQIEGPGTVEDNPLPVGGGLADPANPPYPQTLLPTAFNAPWTVPALTDGARVLVVTPAGAFWVDC